jgi:hypothetical protein
MEFISEEMQKANRLALADHIEKNVTDEQYYHQAFINPVTGAMCAHAHAAAIGMCGLIFEKDYGPSHPDPDLSSAFVNAFPIGNKLSKLSVNIPKTIFSINFHSKRNSL